MGIFPYIYFMIEDFHITEDKSRISFYAGMVTSAFTFAEFATGLFWGRLSDRIGRKPVLLMGLIGTALSVLIFGFAPNLTVALAARAVGGLLNGYGLFPAHILFHLRLPREHLCANTIAETWASFRPRLPNWLP